MCVCVCAYVTESFCCRAEIKKTLYIEAAGEWIKKFGIYMNNGMKYWKKSRI